MKRDLTKDEKEKMLYSNREISSKPVKSIKVIFEGNARDEYEGWKNSNGYQSKKIDELIRESVSHYQSHRGKAEALSGDLKGWYSRRIDQEHRLIYKLTQEGITVKSCKKHYK